MQWVCHPQQAQCKFEVGDIQSRMQGPTHADKQSDELEIYWCFEAWEQKDMF